MLVRSDRNTAGRSRDRGFALLLVLWTVALLVLFSMQIAAVGQTVAQLAGNLEAAADDTAREAVLHLPGGGRWSPASRYRAGLPNTAMEAILEDLANYVRPNAA